MTLSSETSRTRQAACGTLILGLSADPIHAGHVEMVVQSFRRLRDRGYDVNRALLVPVYRRNPVGASKERLPRTYRHRLTMCRLAAREIARRLNLPEQRVSASDVEAELAAERERPNYTAETLKRLKSRLGWGTGFFFLISSELVAGPNPEFGRWYQPETILRLATLTICPRPGYRPNRTFVAALAHHGGRVVYLPEVDTPGISATEVRERLDEGQSPLAMARRGLLPPAIARYLARRNLYDR